jgi:hypothetical protein
VLGLGSGNATFSGAGLAVVAGVGTDEGSTAAACAAVGCAAAAGGVGRTAAANGGAGLAASTVAIPAAGGVRGRRNAGARLTVVAGGTGAAGVHARRATVASFAAVAGGTAAAQLLAYLLGREGGAAIVGGVELLLMTKMLCAML